MLDTREALEAWARSRLYLPDLKHGCSLKSAMSDGHPRDRTRITRRIAIALSIMVLGSLVGALGVFASAVATDLIQGQLMLAVAILGFTVTGIAWGFVANDSKRWPSDLGLALWFGLPRYVWIIGGIGLALALGGVGDAIALKR